MARAHPESRPLARIAQRPVRNAPCPILLLDETAATAPCCRHSGRARAATSRAIRIHFWSERLASWTDPSRRRATASPTSIGQQQEFGIAAALSGDPLMMDAYARAIPTWPSPNRRARSAGCNQDDPQSRAETNSKPACWRSNTAWALRRFAQPYWAAANPGPRAVTAAPGNLSGFLALVRRGSRLRDAHGSLHTVFGWRVQVPPNANPRSLRISRCRQTAPKCCGWPAAWPLNGASRSVRRSMTRC